MNKSDRLIVTHIIIVVVIIFVVGILLSRVPLDTEQNYNNRVFETTSL